MTTVMTCPMETKGPLSLPIDVSLFLVAITCSFVVPLTLPGQRSTRGRAEIDTASTNKTFSMKAQMQSLRPVAQAS